MLDTARTKNYKTYLIAANAGIVILLYCYVFYAKIIYNNLLYECMQELAMEGIYMNYI